MNKHWSFTKKKLLASGVGLGAILCTVLAFAFFGGGAKALEVSAEITNWGLSFQEPGKCPVGNAGKEALAEYDAYFVGDESEKKLYITFDAGYENGNTEKILQALENHGAKATFFLVGNYLDTEPELVKKMVQQGHTVGNHTWSHPDMSKISGEADFAAELQKVEEKYREITGQEMPKIYRPPQGKFCRQNLQMAKALGYHTVFWSLAYVDWYNDKQPTAQEAFDKLIPRIHPGAVVLLHSTSKTNGDILDELLGKWAAEGYSFGTLDELWQ